MSRRSKGEGTIYKRTDGLWVAQITLPDGKRKTKYSKKHKVVQDWLLKQRQAVKQGDWISSESATISQFFDHYMSDVVKHRVRPKTYERYEQYVRLHIKPTLGKVKVAKLRPAHLQKLYSQKLEEGQSKRSVQQMHAVIHKAFNQALKWGLVARNVSDLVEVPKPEKRIPVTLTPEQVKKLFEVLEGDSLKPLYVTAMGTGMRQGELLGLMWQDVNLDNGVIHVSRTAQTIRGEGTVIQETKTEKSKRAIPLSPFVVEALKKQPRTSEFVFPSKAGTPIGSRNLIRHWGDLRIKAGLPEGIRFHDLRHSHATLLLISGTHPKVVQERLGHSQIGITLDTYSHVTPSLQAEAAENLEKMLG